MSYPIVILLSGNGSNCQAIIDAIHKGLPATIKAVLSDNPNAFGLQRAKLAGIPTRVIAPERFADKKQFQQGLQNAIDDYDPALIVLAGFMRILSAEFVQHFSMRIINIHPSLLPKYPGLNTHQQVLDNQEISHGASIHWVTEKLDAGPLIAQAAFKVQRDDTPEKLQTRVHALEHVMYPQVIQWLAQQQALVEL